MSACLQNNDGAETQDPSLPKRLFRASALLSAAWCCCLFQPAFSQTVRVPTNFSDELIVGGLDSPTNAAFLPDGRLLVVERATGKVRLVVNDTLAAVDPVLTVDSLETADWEEGLLGIAVDPGWPSRPYIYVYYTHRPVPSNRIARYTLSGDLAFTGDGSLIGDPASRYVLLAEIPNIFTVHNGGTLRFGPDGMLYAAIGNDAYYCAALNLDDLRGKILRLDVSRLPPGPGGPPDYDLLTPPGNPFAFRSNRTSHLVWHYGLRNPYSFHFDPATGDMFIADVGENTWEEIDSAHGGGFNFGWDLYEGFQRTSAHCPSPDTTAFAFPIYVYSHVQTSGSSVMGGGVYWPPAGATKAFPPEYNGDYFFGDSFQKFLRHLRRNGNTWDIAPPVAGQPDSLNWATGDPWLLTSLQVGPDGGLWYTIYYVRWAEPTGQLRRIVYTGGPVAVARAHTPAFRMSDPAPSPAFGETAVTYERTGPGMLRARVYDLRGRLVRTLARARSETASRGVIRWNGRDDTGRPVAAGVYTIRLDAGDACDERRVLILR
jgi:glucose/arabinose dehydrogenase